MVRTMRAVAVATLMIAAMASAQDTSVIEAAQASWEKAFASGDAKAAAEAVFTEDARLLPPGEPIIEGREAIAAY